MVLVIGPALIGVGFFLFSFLRGTGPVARTIDFSSNRLIPNQIADPSLLTEMRWRRIIEEEEYKESMSKHGFNDIRTDNIFNSQQTLLGISELITAFRRKVIEGDEFFRGMKRLKVPEETTSKFLKITEFRPGPTDLVRFAVREAFTPEIVEKFELDADFPEEVLPRAGEVGIREEDMKLFWRAHWELPSIGLGTEMFHRLARVEDPNIKVSEEDFDLLLRTRDVMTFWRDRIKAVAFTLPTRIDIRRMFRDTHINEEEMFELYRQRGYNKLNAGRMTALAKSFYKDEDRQLSRALITKAFKVGEMERKDAVESMQGLGFSEEDAELIIKLEEISQSDKELDDKIDTFQTLFIEGIIVEAEFAKQLDELNLSANRKRLLITQSLDKKAKRIRLPTKGDIQAFLQKQIITKEVGLDMLREIGTREIDLGRYLQLWGVA